MCSGLFGVRNSAAGAQFLADWWTGDGVPAGDPDAVATAAVEFEKYKTEFPWEQWSLNAMMVPKARSSEGPEQRKRRRITFGTQKHGGFGDTSHPLSPGLEPLGLKTAEQR